MLRRPFLSSMSATIIAACTPIVNTQGLNQDFRGPVRVVLFDPSGRDPESEFSRGARAFDGFGFPRREQDLVILDYFSSLDSLPDVVGDLDRDAPRIFVGPFGNEFGTLLAAAYPDSFFLDIGSNNIFLDNTVAGQKNLAQFVASRGRITSFATRDQGTIRDLRGLYSMDLASALFIHKRGVFSGDQSPELTTLRGSWGVYDYSIRRQRFVLRNR